MFTNAATCLGACEDPMESCNDECGEDYDSCLDRCVDIESFQCICNCAATQKDCRNTCKRAHISCTCGCAPSTKRPTRSPTTTTTTGGTTSSNNDSSVSGRGSKIHATAATLFHVLLARIVRTYHEKEGGKGTPYMSFFFLKYFFKYVTWIKVTPSRTVTLK